MIKTLMYHKVEDFEKWKAAFDDFSEMRKSSGEQNYSVGTVHEKPNTAYVINEWQSMDAYQAFMGSPDLGDAMKAAGVLEQPHSMILNEVEKGSVG